MIRVLATLVLLLAVAAPVAPPISTAFAQTTQTQVQAPDYKAWEAVVSRAEEVIQEGRASNAALEALRNDLADWRSRFLEAQDINAARIRALRDSLDALGPPPAEGETEAEAVAQRRKELNAQLADLQAPGLRAVEAHSRADGLIKEIDRLIRERQADALLELGPSPLNPANWDDAISALVHTTRSIGEELVDNWRNPSVQATFRGNLPATILFLVLAGVLLARGRHWMERLTQRVVESGSASGRTAYAGLASLGQIAVPLVGVFLLTAALNSTGLLGFRSERLVKLLPVLGLTVLAARWLGGRVFAETTVSRPIFNLTPEGQAAGRLNSGLLGLLIALAMLTGTLAGFSGFTPGAVAVVTFPVLLIAGLMLSRMAQLLLSHAKADAVDTEDRPYRNRLIVVVARAALVVGLIGPALGAIGYTEAAAFLVYPSILSLALLGLLLVLQRFVTDIYDLLTGHSARSGEDDAAPADALIPVLAGMLLVLAALPVLALIWGARVTDLTEVWTRFNEGFSIGQTRISPTDFLTFALVFGLGYALTRVVQGTLRSTVLPKTKIDPGGQTALVSGIGYVGIFLAAIIAVTTAGIDLSSLAIVAGALSVGIGFGLQTIVSNFVSGIILLIERPVSQGDWIEVGGNMGIVKDISVRSTRIQTFDRTDVIVPNSDLISGTVTNWTRQNLTGRLIIKVGVAYGTDTRRVAKVLQEIGEAQPLAMLNPPPTVVFQGFGADALEFELRIILRDVNQILGVQTEINHEIARRFAEEGFEIPFAQRDIWLRNPETLGPRDAQSAAAPTPVTDRAHLDESDMDTGADPDADGGDAR